MDLRKLAVLVGVVVSALAATPAAADVVVVSETRTLAPPGYSEIVRFNLPAPGIYDVQLTSEEMIDLGAFWRWTEVTDVRIDPPDPQAGLLVWHDLNNTTGGYFTDVAKTFAFSFEVHQPKSSSYSFCPIVCPPDLADSPSTVTFSAIDPYLEFFNFGEAGTEPLTQPFEYTLLITRRGSTVPEPAAWALMILGFGAAGEGLRRRRAPSAA